VSATARAYGLVIVLPVDRRGRQADDLQAGGRGIRLAGRRRLPVPDRISVDRCRSPHRPVHDQRDVRLVRPPGNQHGVALVLQAAMLSGSAPGPVRFGASA
jgi:hypothetical protein